MPSSLGFVVPHAVHGDRISVVGESDVLARLTNNEVGVSNAPASC